MEQLVAIAGHPGFTGVIVGIGILITLWAVIFSQQKHSAYEFDPGGEKGSFEKLLATYIDLMKFVLGLASGTVVLLVSADVVKQSAGTLARFASPLFLFVISIMYGIAFMTLLTLEYERYRHGSNHRTYTRRKYVTVQALGFSCLCCFCFGYVSLIVMAVG